SIQRFDSTESRTIRSIAQNAIPNLSLLPTLPPPTTFPAMYKYIIMGIQGCGKGTQAKLLCEAYDFVHISIGDQFRWHIANHTKLAAKVNRIISGGHMVDDDLVAKVVAERLSWHDWNYGFVLDGFPRTFAQAEFLFEN